MANCRLSWCCVSVVAAAVFLVIGTGAFLYGYFTHNPLLRSTFWQTTKLGIRTVFLDVRHETTETVAKWMEDGWTNLTFVDARRPDEFAVSRLKDAINIPENSTVEEVAGIIDDDPRLSAEHTIVVYCSAGYRSSIVARTIMNASESFDPPLDVRNMIGSIFEWANDGRPMVDDQGKPTKLVHPHSQTFGRLLHRKLWSTDDP